MLQKLALVPIASYKSIFFELIGICAWTVGLQLICLEGMARFLDFPVSVFEGGEIEERLGYLTEYCPLFHQLKDETRLYKFSCRCNHRPGFERKCLEEEASLVIKAATQLRLEIEERFNQYFAQDQAYRGVVPTILSAITSAERKLKR